MKVENTQGVESEQVFTVMERSPGKTPVRNSEEGETQNGH